MSSMTYDVVLAQLVPYVGEKMARALIQMHCQAVGVSAGSLGPSDLTVLAGRLETALRAFVGSARAAAVVKSIRALG
ncbi:MAG TPA: hypothetical protein VNT75_12200 [Symbiobacteriaceae bacterium]|nr:hypothetical protein [Symbiobacteriaceae bacterium]